MEELVPLTTSASPEHASAADLIDRLRTKRARIGVIGLGYVGLPLAVEFADAGCTVTPVDLDQAQGRQHPPRRVLHSRRRRRSAARGGRGRPAVARRPTSRSSPTSTPSASACRRRSARRRTPTSPTSSRPSRRWPKYLRRGQLVVLESTTYPGTTEEVVRPMLERGGLVAGRDFFLAFSPERVDPANAEWHTGNTPKVVGGVDRASTDAACALYAQIVSDDRAGVVDQRRRDGQAAREHVPGREHRHGQRAGADVPRRWTSTSGK